jgi:hypothetical protein
MRILHHAQFSVTMEIYGTRRGGRDALNRPGEAAYQANFGKAQDSAAGLLRAELVESSSNARPRDRRYSSSATARNGTPRCNAARAEQNHDRRPAFSELSSIDAALLCRFYGYLHKDMDINNDERDPFAPSANRPSCEQS